MSRDKDSVIAARKLAFRKMAGDYLWGDYANADSEYEEVELLVQRFETVAEKEIGATRHEIATEIRKLTP
jgi:hypothetical protein